jgi:hypothetical protein
LLVPEQCTIFAKIACFHHGNNSFHSGLFAFFLLFRSFR